VIGQSSASWRSGSHMAGRVAAQLARGGEVGSIWALGRPFVYHSLERLEESGLIRSVGLERGLRGPHRVVYAVTPEGEAARAQWLCTPGRARS